MNGKKPGPRKLLSAESTFERNYGTALFGEAVHTERQMTLLKLVGTFENARKRPQKLQATAVRHCERQFDMIARPILLEALTKLDPEPFRELADLIKKAQQIRSARPALEFHARALCMAEEVVMEAQWAEESAKDAWLAEAAGVEEARNPGAAAVFRKAEAAGVDVCLAEMAVAAGLAGELKLPAESPEASVDVRFEPGKPLPITLNEFKAKLKKRYWPKLSQEAEPSDSYVRRECKRVGIFFKPDKVGRRRNTEPKLTK